jgi:HlyD family secretion protein
MASGAVRTLSVTFAVIVAVAAFLAFRSYQRSFLDIRTAHPARESIHTGVVTNGKSEPIMYRELRAEMEGEVSSLDVREGETVRPGQRLLALGQRQSESDLQQARAELAEAQEALRLLRQGGTAAQIAELRAQADAARREREIASKQVQENERLVERGAVARVELELSRQRLAKAESELKLAEEKLARRYDPEEITRAEARVEAARAALGVAEFQLRAAVASSPLAGTVYSVPVRPGDHVNRGDVLARVGDVSRIRVRVFVDEPDLGRVAAGQKVLVTWDGLPGREWTGTVEQLPSEVEELGSRTVGEVACTVDNPSGELLPNTNVNVEIVTESKDNILALPREAVFGAEAGRHVFIVRSGALVQQAVQTGILSATRAEVLSGVSENDEVALAGEQPFTDGMRVRISNE